MSFVHLHLHSEYSLLDGACRIREIPILAKQNGHTAVALTDHGNLYGAVDFYRACKEQGIQPIIGCEVYVAPHSRLQKDQRDAKYYHLVLLCKNEIGYRNLIKLVSEAYTSGYYYKPRIDLDLLSEYKEGLIALSGCVAGEVAQNIIKNDFQQALACARNMQAMFGEDYYLEIQNHGLKEEEQVREGVLAISRELGIAMVATNDVHYPTKKDANTQAVLMCIQTNRQITDGRPVGFENDEYDFKSTAEMENLFSMYPAACANTEVIANKCHFDFDFSSRHLPSFPLPQGVTADSQLRELAEKGLAERRDAGELDLVGHSFDDYKFRMIYELMMIAKMGYSDYFLIVSDFVNYAKNKKIPVGPGRGSGAGSLVAYLIRITEVDSIRYGLLFERFLNPERVSMPDFDIDFCYERRDEVIAYVQEKYGSDHVAQIAAFGTMAARAAIRDVGRALAMPYGEIDRVAKLVPHSSHITIRDALQSEEKLKELYENEYRYRELLDIAMALEGMPRHLTIHAAGVVITKEPVYNYVPLTTSGDSVLTQFDMNTVADLGLLKFDFLALRYLTVADSAARSVSLAVSDFDIERIPLDDAETFALLSAGDTAGIFQLESDGMRRLLISMQPKTMEDIMVAIALYRPGPMESIPAFLRNRRNPASVTYDTELLREILVDTAGCIVYQEQVMQIFRKLAGYSFGRADLVRKAMSKKNAQVMEEERNGFVEGCIKNRINREVANAIFDRMAAFASYAFNKSHAAAYALLSYRTAYLKAHYRTEYAAALLSSTMGNQAKTAEYISDCANKNISILPPNVNLSMGGFTAHRGNILFGLSAIKGIGDGMAAAITKERQKGNYKDVFDFAKRTVAFGLGKLQLTSLIQAGALDCFGVYRSRLLESVEPILNRAGLLNRELQSGQTSLFQTDEVLIEDEFKFPDIPKLSVSSRLQMEKEMTGLYLSGSVLSPYRNAIQSIPHISIGALIAQSGESETAIVDRQKITVCGVITKITHKTTKNGSNMYFLTIEDDLGSVEAIVFPRGNIAIDKLCVGFVGAFHAVVSTKEDGDVKLLLESFVALQENASPVVQTKTNEQAPAHNKSVGNKLYLRIQNEAQEKRILALTDIFPGNVAVYIYDGEYRKCEKGLAVSEYILAFLRDMLGENSVVIR